MNSLKNALLAVVASAVPLNRPDNREVRPRTKRPTLTGRVRLFTVTALLVVASAVLTQTGGVAQAQAGGVVPADTGNACQTVSWGLTCINITGTGLHIDTAKAWLRNNTSNHTYQNVHVDLYYKSGSYVIKSCASFTLYPNSNSPNCVWAPNANEPSGYYCTRAWQKVGTTYTLAGDECVSVHT